MYHHVLPVLFRILSLLLGQSYGCLSVGEDNLKNMGDCIPVYYFTLHSYDCPSAGDASMENMDRLLKCIHKLLKIYIQQNKLEQILMYVLSVIILGMGSANERRRYIVT